MEHTQVFPFIVTGNNDAVFRKRQGLFGRHEAENNMGMGLIDAQEGFEHTFCVIAKNIGAKIP
ncbi:hypothetical protein ACU81Q_05400 [Komagataeibacter melomenusus]